MLLYIVLNCFSIRLKVFGRVVLFMKCPKCGSAVGEHDVVCPKCGAELFIDTKLAEKIFTPTNSGFENEKDNAPKPKKRLQLKKPDLDSSKLRIALIVILALIVVVLVVLIVVSIIGSKGEKLAKRSADFIGADYEVAETKIDAKLKKESAYKGLTAVAEYDLIAEADDNVRVDGVTYPEWAVLFSVDDQNRITTVRYCNFGGLKKDIKGEKKRFTVNLDKFDKGASKDVVDKELDMKPYSIQYTKEGTTFIYRYWYENDSGDEQPVILYVNFDNDSKFINYSSIMVNHQYM